MQTPQLRPYQVDLEQKIYAAWGAGNRNVGARLATGGGKTMLFGKILSDHRKGGGFPGAIAHRRELVQQISLALGRYGVRHRVIAPKPVVRKIEAAHLRAFNMRFVDPNASAWVAGVDTLINMDPKDSLLLRTSMWVQDEAHHVLKANKWGQAADMLPNAYGLGVSATWFRADGKGLGRHAQGLMDVLVHGPEMRELIDWGYLTDYRLITAETDLDLASVDVSTATGDYSATQLRAVVHKSARLVGDAVSVYMEHTPGLLGITFAVDVEEAVKLAAAFRAAGVPAEVVHAGTDSDLRDSIMRRFAAGEVKMLVNVDLFGEGFDLPAVRVVIMARPTMSKALYDQQFGRALRLMLSPILMGAWDAYSPTQRLQFIAESEKPCGIIIDLVGNWTKHGLPDGHRDHTLDQRASRGSKGGPAEIPLRVCTNSAVNGVKGWACGRDYPANLKCCPFCGYAPVPVGRSGPEQVAGNVLELTPEALAALRAGIQQVDGPATFPRGAAPEVVGAIKRRHWERQQAQATLRDAIALWAGSRRDKGETDDEIHRAFWYLFGVDTLSAQALGKTDAEELTARINACLAIDGIVNKAQYEAVN